MTTCMHKGMNGPVRENAIGTKGSQSRGAQVHRQTADGEWRLEPTEGVAVVASHKALVAAALADVKYDKIAVVREVRCWRAWRLLPCVSLRRGMPALKLQGRYAITPL